MSNGWAKEVLMVPGQCSARFVERGDERAVQIESVLDGRGGSIFFRSEEVKLQPRGEVLAAALLLPAMRRGVPLLVADGLDAQFGANLTAVQRIFREWDGGLQTVTVQAPTRLGGGARDGRVGVFFSGGVDSLYTFLRHREEITDLVLVHGFDIRLDDRQRIDWAFASAQRVAAAFGKRVIKVETNIRTLLNHCGGWAELGQGPALAAVAHALPDEFSRVYIAATVRAAEPAPCGSHPQLDPLWSSARLGFIHDGAEASRVEKVRLLSRSAVALENLRVCYRNRKGQLNCGRCEKCIRTMLCLRVAGCLERCPTFSVGLRLRRILNVTFPGYGVDLDYQECLAELCHRPEARYLAHALAFAMWRNRLEGDLRWRVRRAAHLRPRT